MAGPHSLCAQHLVLHRRAAAEAAPLNNMSGGAAPQLRAPLTAGCPLVEESSPVYLQDAQPCRPSTAQ